MTDYNLTQEGNVVQDLLDAVAGGYVFMGTATPTTTPDTTNPNVCYLATTPGTYTNFNSLVLAAGNIGVFCWNGSSWSIDTTPTNEISISGDIFKTTMLGSYIGSNGALTTAARYNSMQYTMVGGYTYKIIQQTVPTAGNYYRVFKLSGTTYTQITAEQGSGTTSYYVCPNDGYTYILQLIVDTNTTNSLPQLFIIEDIQQYEGRTDSIIEPITESDDLWEAEKKGYYDASHTFTSNTRYNACEVSLENGYQYKVVQQSDTTTGNNLRVWRVEGTTYTQVLTRKSNITEYIDCPNDGYNYVLQVIFDNKSGSYKILPHIYRLGKKEEKTISLLAIGNSYSRDALSYLPFLLKESGVDIRIGILYKGSCTLQQHYTLISTDGDYEAYDVYEPTSGVWETRTGINISTALQYTQCDIVTLQQQSSNSRDYTTFQPYLNDIITLVTGMAGFPIKYGWILTPAYPTGYSGLGDDTSDEMFTKICTAVGKVMDETAIDFYIPCGTAIQNARKSSLNSLGDFGGLTYEGLHLQEGIPCLLEAYVAAMYILNITGKGNRGIYASLLRPTQTWVTAHAIPQQNGNSVGVTDANCVLAQKCASFAIRKPLVITDITTLGI